MPASQKTLFGAAPAPRSFDQDALGFLIAYARKHKGQAFSAEQVTLAAIKRGIAPLIFATGAACSRRTHAMGTSGAARCFSRGLWVTGAWLRDGWRYEQYDAVMRAIAERLGI